MLNDPDEEPSSLSPGFFHVETDVAELLREPAVSGYSCGHVSMRLCSVYSGAASCHLSAQPTLYLLKTQLGGSHSQENLHDCPPVSPFLLTACGGCSQSRSQCFCSVPVYLLSICLSVHLTSVPLYAHMSSSPLSVFLSCLSIHTSIVFYLFIHLSSSQSL